MLCEIIPLNTDKEDKGSRRAEFSSSPLPAARCGATCHMFSVECCFSKAFLGLSPFRFGIWVSHTEPAPVLCATSSFYTAAQPLPVHPRYWSPTMDAKGKACTLLFILILRQDACPLIARIMHTHSAVILWFRSQENYLSLARAQAQHSLNRSLFQCRIWHYFRTGNLKILKYSLAANFCLKEVAPQGTCGRKLTTENIQFSAWVKKRWAMYRLVY